MTFLDLLGYILIIWVLLCACRVTVDVMEEIMREIWDNDDDVMSDIIQVYLDLDTENGCWNCQNSYGSICRVNNIGTIDYLKGISHCGLRDWKFNDGDVE